MDSIPWKERLAARLFSASLIATMALSVVTRCTLGQIPDLEQAPPRPRSEIPRPKQFKLRDPAVQRIELKLQKPPDAQQETRVAPTIPDIAPLQGAAEASESEKTPRDSGATPAPPPRLPVDTALSLEEYSSRSTWRTRCGLAGARAISISRSPGSKSLLPRPT